MLFQIYSLYRNFSESENPCPYKILICLKIVLFPDSPVPRSSNLTVYYILINIYTYSLSINTIVRSNWSSRLFLSISFDWSKWFFSSGVNPAKQPPISNLVIYINIYNLKRFFILYYREEQIKWLIGLLIELGFFFNHLLKLYYGKRR